MMITMALAGHPNAVMQMDAFYPGWRDMPWFKERMFTGTWNEDFTVFTPNPPAFQDDPPPER
jgi:hypothetical protein